MLGSKKRPRVKQRRSEGKGKRIYMPKAKAVRYIVDDNYYAVPGRHGMAWEYIGDGLVKDAPYSIEDAAALRQALKEKRISLRDLILQMNPSINPERLQRMVSKGGLLGYMHAKQREHERTQGYSVEIEQLGKLTKRRDKRKKRRQRDALKALKDLLRTK